MGQDLKMKSDLELVEEVKSGNRSAFSELVLRHQRGLLRLSLRFLKSIDAAEDVVQESFIKAFEKLNSFEGRSSFKSWLYQITLNTARNKYRERDDSTMEIENVHIGVRAQAETTLVETAISALIQTEVDKLPYRQKTALMLRVYEDLSFKEIAEVMECPYDTAKANYRHALLKLKTVFEDNDELRSWNFNSSQELLTEMNYYAEVEG